RFEQELAPQTREAIRRNLPFDDRIIHCRWSGESNWIPWGDRELGIGPENATSYPHPGELALYPGGQSETELLLPYGYCSFASKAGHLWANHFATLVEGQEQLSELGRRTLWALDRLRRHGHTETRLDLGDLARRNVELFRERPDYMKGEKVPSPRASALLTGETGILLVAWRLTPSPELADDLLARVRQNVDNEADELMWGSPGTLLAAQAMLDWTGEE